MELFKDKTVIVTGSSSGIGAETAVHFARQGAKVVLTARRKEKLEATAARCREEAGTTDDKILIVSGDITNPDVVADVIAQTVATFGGIDVLVNNAGGFVATTFDTTSTHDLDTMYDLNVKSAFRMCKAAAPYLKQSQGSIVNVSSEDGLRALPATLPYSMAKAALDQFTKCLAIELAPFKVRVNSVNPGAIATEIFLKPVDGGDFGAGQHLDEIYAAMAPYYPLGRVGQASEVAHAIVWLASPQASFITGLLMPIDGGRTITTPFMPPQ